MAERNRRGIKAEMEESREILEAYVEENKTLVALLARGRALVQSLQVRERLIPAQNSAKHLLLVLKTYQQGHPL